MTLPEQMKADGWIEHDGKGCPVDPMRAVHYRLRDGDEDTRGWLAQDLDWSWPAFGDDPLCDVVAYRLANPEQPQ